MVSFNALSLTWYEKTIRVLPDTNLFIAASKSGITKSTALIFKLCFDPSIGLIGNSILADEFERYENLVGRSGKILLEIVKERIKVVEPDSTSIEKCKPYIPEKEFADLYHAATCLQTGAILITNDRHFDKIKEEGIIEVWSISEAIARLL